MIKLQKLKEAGEEVADLAFNESSAEGNNYSQKNSAEVSTQTEKFDFLDGEGNQCPKVKPLNEHEFTSDYEKVRFYTGLPSFEVLKTTFDHVAPFVSRKWQHLTPFQEFILTLMKLRLNMAFQDLAYCFTILL